MVRIIVGNVVQMVPERVARMVLSLVAKAERIGAADSGRVLINWRRESVQAEISECIEVPRSPE